MNTTRATETFIMLSQSALHQENVYGHTKKVRLTLKAIAKRHLVRKDNSLKILDIGCGNGFAVTQFLGHMGDDVLAIDFHKPNIDFAKHNFSNKKMHFECLDARTLQAEGCIYDVIVLADILEHLDEPDEMLGICQALLADDGRIILTIPNGFGPFEFESYVQKIPLLGPSLVFVFDLAAAALDRWVLKGRWTELAQREPKDLPYNEGSPHVQWYTMARMERLISNAGLQVDNRCNLSLFSGPFSNYLFGPFVKACEANAWIADKLPHCMVSAWWMEVSKLNHGAPR